MLEAAEIDGRHQHQLAARGLGLEEGDQRQFRNVELHRDRARERGAGHGNRRDVELEAGRFDRARVQRAAVLVVAQHRLELGCRILGLCPAGERGRHRKRA